MANDQYVLLASNQNCDIFNNECNQFKVNKELDLKGKWEVALMEMTYPRNWNTFKTDCQIIFMFGRYAGNIATISKNISDENLKPLMNFISNHQYQIESNATTDSYVGIDIKASYYEKEIELIDQIKKLFQTELWHFNYGREKGLECDLIMEYDKYQNIMEIRGPRAMAFVNGKEYIKALGLSNGFEINDNLTFFEIPCISSNLHVPIQIPTLYVYSNVVEHNFVGDTSVPLLRSVQVTGEPFDYVPYAPTRALYKPVSNGYIRPIEIMICGNNGEKVPFNKGIVEVLLHFRKCKLDL